MKKFLLPAACYLFPGVMARFVYHKMTHPRLVGLRQHEAAVLDSAEKEVVAIRQFQIQTYKWPGGEKKILLVHGWEGQAGNFAYLVDGLLNQDYTVYAFDGPAHGRSSRNAVTFFDFSEVVGELLKRFGVRKVLCHSFGSVATIYALHQNRDLRMERMVLLTTPNQLMEAVEDARNKFGLTEAVCRRVVRRIQKETGYDLRQMAVQDFVHSVSVDKALMIHDKADAVLPIERSEAVCRNWPACELVEVEGTGHFRILRSAEVLNMAASFLNGGDAHR